MTQLTESPQPRTIIHTCNTTLEQSSTYAQSRTLESRPGSPPCILDVIALSYIFSRSHMNKLNIPTYAYTYIYMYAPFRSPQARSNLFRDLDPLSQTYMYMYIRRGDQKNLKRSNKRSRETDQKKGAETKSVQQFYDRKTSLAAAAAGKYRVLKQKNKKKTGEQQTEIFLPLRQN